MARRPRRTSRRPAAKQINKPTSLERLTTGERRKLISRLRAFIRSEGETYLADPNITSIGIGLRVEDKEEKASKERYSDEVCIQFTVGTKLETEADIESLGSAPIPETITIDGQDIPTDVLERTFTPSWQELGPEAIEEQRRKTRRATLLPGISIGHPTISAGTLGLIVFDVSTASPLILSNWHVLQGNAGRIGDDIVQPGRHDDSRTHLNVVGNLTRSHLGVAGDCAVATIKNRDFSGQILDIDVAPTRLARVELGDRVVKSGRTTGTTFGIVRRTDVEAEIDYKGATGVVIVGGFEIGPDPNRPAERDEISLGGDSGSAWLVVNDDGTASDIWAGLHFAGETGSNPDEHALACYAHAVLKKLGASLTPPAIVAEQAYQHGYSTQFLSEPVSMPSLPEHLLDDAVVLDNSHLIPYTHFSVCQSKSRKLPRFVAWNVDGNSLKRISRRGLRFRLDPRFSRSFQAGNELYRNNRLDRGHVARRADLIWGELEEAKQANSDSFFYTNITPQHSAFNQSSRAGLWGRLENAIFDDVSVEDLKISVISGPIFRETDPLHRGVPIPRDYWKLIAYRDTEDDQFKVKSFVLSQSDLLTDIEVLELDEFRLFEVSLIKLEELTDLSFGDLVSFDAFDSRSLREVVPNGNVDRQSGVREILSATSIFR